MSHDTGKPHLDVDRTASVSARFCWDGVGGADDFFESFASGELIPGRVSFVGVVVGAVLITFKAGQDPPFSRVLRRLSG